MSSSKDQIGILQVVTEVNKKTVSLNFRESFLDFIRKVNMVSKPILYWTRFCINWVLQTYSNLIAQG